MQYRLSQTFSVVAIAITCGLWTAWGSADPVVAAPQQGDIPAASPAAEGADAKPSPATPEQLEFFEKQVRPLFIEHCHKCHGKEKQKGELRLDSRAALLKGGETGPAIVPGKPDEGELYTALTYDPNGYQMPPAGKLPQASIDIIKKWIEMGAPWPEGDADVAGAESGGGGEHVWDKVRDERAKHWSFQPLSRPDRPGELPEWSQSWTRNPIDEFIAKKLGTANLQPAPQADRHTWLRRLSYDVIGLPPTPEEIASFLADDSPEAYSRQVDRLLSSPHYGERWGRHWLDLMRYAESRGHEFDYDVANPWHYRDYVVRALNADLPYDQFVVEHIAGDLLPPPDISDDRQGENEIPSKAQPSQSRIESFRTRLHPETGGNESILATGYWFLGEWVHSPVDIRQEEAERFENMIDVTSKAFLGLTVACARCHDHKFDPISAADFYAMQSYLQSSSYRQVPFESMEQNRRVGEDLIALRRRANDPLLRTFSEAVETTVNDLDKYLLASREALSLGVKFQQELVDIPFATFESGTYDGWTATGDAFGDAPQTQATLAQYQGDVGAAGKAFVNTHRKPGVGNGDNHVGTLTSKPFKIERALITMLVGGGAHQGKTCVNLIIDDKVVRTQTGKNDNRMQRVSWDVRELIGSTATIQIVDNERGGWGNIGVDDIVFTQQEGASTLRSPEDLDPKFRRQLVTVARDHAVNVRILESWVVWGASTDGQQDPLFGSWCRGEDATIQLAPTGVTPLGKLAQFEGELIADYRAHPDVPNSFTPTAPIIDGPMFATGLRHRGDLLYSPSRPISETNSPKGQAAGARNQRGRKAGKQTGPTQTEPSNDQLTNDDTLFNGIALESSIERDRFWDGLAEKPGNIGEPGRVSDWHRGGRLLRTPTFKITQPKVYALIKGGVRTYAAVDSHITINGPLHGSLLREHASQEGWRWIEHDVARYRGHGAHLEFIPFDDADIAVALVVQSAAPPQLEFQSPEAGNSPDNATLDAPPSGVSDERVANWYRNRFEVVLHALYGEGGAKLTTSGNAEIANWMMQHPALVGIGPEARERLRIASAQVVEQIQELKSQRVLVSATAPAMLDGNFQEEYVFIRGNWKKPGESVPPRFLEVFPQNVPVAPSNAASSTTRSGDDAAAMTSTRGSGRLQLAAQMIDPQQTPILARVIVNRIWLHEFGRGLVPTPDDFGHLGQPPSHPELLDWLATELIENGWSIKHIHRLILNSATYRMSSDLAASTDSLVMSHIAQVDPSNVLLHRMNVKRLEGEIIRDAILMGSGRLDPHLGGPSVPIHLTPFLDGRGRPGASGPVDGNGRRSLYISVRRNFAEPFFQAFDFPNPHSTIGRRSVSNVPAQALSLMNNPFVIEQARVWANRLLQQTPSSTIEDRLDRLYLEAFGRQPAVRELNIARTFVESQSEELGVPLDSPAIWGDTIHAMINAKEFIFIR